MKDQGNADTENMLYPQVLFSFLFDARISLRDIGPILKKSGSDQSLSNSSQAYQLFSEGKTPIQVAIKLDLKEPEVHEFYKQYWKLDYNNFIVFIRFMNMLKRIFGPW